MNVSDARKNLTSPEELKVVGWNLPEGVPRLPNSIIEAAKSPDADTMLGGTLGQDAVDYWVNTRKLEWLSFHSECGDLKTKRATQWEYNRYFELV